MDAALYPRIAELEDTHWWFSGRRAICERILDRLALPCSSMILEVGCGTGGNFPMLAGCLITMVLAVVGLNQTWWRWLHEQAETRFRFER